MPISGLVIIFEGPVERAADTLDEIRNHVAIEVGEISDNKCAIVVDTPTADEDRRVWTWLQDLPEVIDVRLAFVGVDDDADAE